jgi:4-hydroxy-3-polyprenylbenzoate decarboxylase
MSLTAKAIRRIVVAVTGASGARYALRTVQALLAAECNVVLLLSRAGADVLHYETGIDWHGPAHEVQTRIQAHFCSTCLQHYAVDDLFAPVASGSSAPDAVIVVPCSMGSIGRIAAGLGASLIERVADVALKEGKPLLVIPRETPLHAIHLENLLRLARAGAHIVPAMPAYYQRPASLDDLDAFMAGKILDLLGIEHALFPRWEAGSDKEH